MHPVPGSITVITCALALTACGSQVPERVARAPDRDAAPSLHVASEETSGVLVDVSGHVRRPGVYRLRPGGRVHEAIAAAGGARSGAQLGSINRAATVVDGQQVVVAGPTADGAAGASGGPTGAAPGTLVSINSADASELDQLPGIGPITAERIVAERESGGPFAGIDDLDRVPGIGPATIEALRTVVRT